MKLLNAMPSDKSDELIARYSDMPIPQLVGEVCESVPVMEKARLIEYLLRPLGILSLVGVAHGVFAKIWFRNPRQDVQITFEDARSISATDVSSLVDFVQQVSTDTVDGLSQLLSASPELLGSATAALMVTLLMHRLNARHREGRANVRSVVDHPAQHSSVPPDENAAPVAKVNMQPMCADDFYPPKREE